MQKQFTIALLGKDGKQLSMEVRQKCSQVSKRKVKTWTNEEDNQLLQLYERFPKKWGQIATNMSERNQNQCLHRYRRLSQLGKSHKIWSSEEDETIKKLIKKYGKNWKLLSQMLGSKNGKQIRERFINKLDPRIKKEEWTDQEDRKIIELYSRVGSKWSEISKNIPGRPQNKIKNRFYSFIQKNYDIKLKEVENITPNLNSSVVQNKTQGDDANRLSTYEPLIARSFNFIDHIPNKSDNKLSEDRIISKYNIPSINEIEFEPRNQPLISNSMLESAFREEEWRCHHHYYSIIELNSTDLFYRFQN